MTDEHYAGRAGAPPQIVRAIGGMLLLALVVVVVVSLLMRDGGDAASPPQNQGTTTETATPTVEPTGSVTPTDAAVPDGQTYVTVVAEGLKLRDQPSREGNILKSLATGQKLQWFETSGGWYRVQDGTGTEGWVAAGPEYSQLVQP